jgi:hypothetical protein
MAPNVDPVEVWLNQLDPKSRRQYRFVFNTMLQWLHTQNGFETFSPIEILRLQRANNRKLPSDDDDMPQLALSKMLKEYINAKDTRLQTKVTQWATIKSFFKYNDTVFPDPISVNLRSEKDPSKSELNLEVIRKCVTAAKLRDRAWLLVKWQSFQDQERMDYINRKLTDHVVSEMQKGHTVIRLDLLGRKKGVKEKKAREYFTFVGQDAIQALGEYFDKERGWPKKGEALWLNLKGEPFEYAMYSEIWLGLLRRLGYIPKQKEKAGVDRRYGYGLHEFRDVAISYLHTNAKSRGLDLDAIHFMLGHTKNLDPNKYDKFYEDANYGVAQYRIAEPYLNILSQPQAATGDEVEKLRGEVERLRGQFETLAKAKFTK